MHTYIQESKRWEFIFGETKLSSSILELAREWGLRQGRESSVVLKLVIIPGEALYWKYKSPTIRTPDLRELAPPSLHVLDVISKIGQKLQPPPTYPPDPSFCCQLINHLSLKPPPIRENEHINSSIFCLGVFQIIWKQIFNDLKIINF